MGLSNSNSDRKTFVNIINGKLTVKTDKENPLAVARKNKKDETVYEIHHDKLTGVIVSMNITKNDFGKQLEVELDDVGERFLVTIPVESKYFDSFAAKIGNAKHGEEITIAPYSFQPKDSETKRTGINLYQGGTKLEYYFSEANPRGKPFPASAKLDEDDWKMFKLQERKFYCEYIGTLQLSRELNRNVEYTTEKALSMQKPVAKEVISPKNVNTMEQQDDDQLPF